MGWFFQCTFRLWAGAERGPVPIVTLGYPERRRITHGWNGRVARGIAPVRQERAFTGACQAGDAESCAAIDRRFTRVRYLGEPPVPPYPKAARDKRVEGTWAATCTFTRAGEVTGCTVERPVAELDRPFLDWIRAGPWQASTLDGRSFGCEYRLEFTLRIN